MKLAILIPTLQKRRKQLEPLLDSIPKQIGGLRVKVFTYPANGRMTTGEKRNKLINTTDAEYIVFLDDDDEVSSEYVSSLLEEIEQKPDVITFEGWMTTNGKNRVDWVLKQGLRYEERNGIYERFPNHLCCWKREVAKLVKFNHINHGEDIQWACPMNGHLWVGGANPIRYNRFKPLYATSVHIPKQLYHYKYVTGK